MIQDMTEGSPSRQLWLFSLPLLFSVIFQQLYNIVDSVVAGRFVGENALAAVGVSYPITMIFMAVATGANIGCSVIISQLFGARQYGRMKTAVNTSLVAVAFLSLLLTAVGLPASAPLLRLLQTPSGIFADSALYLRVYVGGLFFLFLYNICTGIFTALGDSRTPLYFLIASSLGNIALDLLFVIAFHMGVGGVAWATFLCQGIASLLAFFALIRRLRGIQAAADDRPRVFSATMLGRISLIAIPSILQQSFVSVGNLCIQGLVNSFGPAVIAGYSASVKLNTFAITSFSTLANGLSSFSAQNIGAGKLERVKHGFRAGLIMAVIVALLFTAAFFGFSEAMVRLFVSNPTPEALEAGLQFLKLVAPFYAVVTVKLMADSVLRGAGCMAAFMITTFSDLILRVALSYLLAGRFGAVGIWASWPVGWILSAALSLIFYASGVWKRRASTPLPS